VRQPTISTLKLLRVTILTDTKVLITRKRRTSFISHSPLPVVPGAAIGGLCSNLPNSSLLAKVAFLVAEWTNFGYLQVILDMQEGAVIRNWRCNSRKDWLAHDADAPDLSRAAVDGGGVLFYGKLNWSAAATSMKNTQDFRQFYICLDEFLFHRHSLKLMSFPTYFTPLWNAMIC